MISYYQILQVEETATDAEIKQAYRSLSKVLHPDLNNNSAEANTIFRLLQEAYDTLSDPLKRKEYDIDPTSKIDDSDTNSRIESYKEQNKKQSRKLKEYEEMLKNYKQSVYLKDQRERELTKELIHLKERILESERIATEKLNREKVIPHKHPEFSWPMIILLIVGAHVGFLLTYLSISSIINLFF